MPKIFGAGTLMKSHPNGLGGASRQPGRKVYSSPLKRCMRTAAAIADACEAPSKPLEALNDLD